MLALIRSVESQVFECWILITEDIHHNLSYEKIQVKHVLQDYINSVFCIQFSLLITFAHFLSDRSTF